MVSLAYHKDLKQGRQKYTHQHLQMSLTNMYLVCGLGVTALSQVCKYLCLRARDGQADCCGVSSTAGVLPDFCGDLSVDPSSSPDLWAQPLGG